jgi:hypothetical protein
MSKEERAITECRELRKINDVLKTHMPSELAALTLAFRQVDLSALLLDIRKMFDAIPQQLFNDIQVQVQARDQVKPDDSETYAIFKDLQRDNFLPNLTLKQYKEVLAEWKKQRSSKYNKIIPSFFALAIAGCICVFNATFGIQVLGAALLFAATVELFVAAPIACTDYLDYKNFKQVGENIDLYLKLKFHGAKLSYALPPARTITNTRSPNQTPSRTIASATSPSQALSRTITSATSIRQTPLSPRISYSALSDSALSDEVYGSPPRFAPFVAPFELGD